ncbi:hypothetical protein CMUS01_06328 [Colletotrichum musicola]|uniref:Protein kinase domain-containing protein n=1 Tax=Colletotrichum musicola TaxID=2175873 RepID=A0A8H6KM38_9PEZI|nr:hypothetical protein CMUS01_06328 [Colletotrichum musicola]
MVPPAVGRRRDNTSSPPQSQYEDSRSSPEDAGSNKENKPLGRHFKDALGLSKEKDNELEDRLQFSTPAIERVAVATKGITDASISADFTHLYGEGQKLHLTHHKPCNPYGTAHHPIPPGVNINDLSYTFETAQVPRTQAVFNYKPTPYKPTPSEVDEDNQSLEETEKIQDLTLTIIKSLSGGLRAGPQVLLCKVNRTKLSRRREGMGDMVVAKIFDPLFFPLHTPDYEGPWTNTAFADMAFSREAAAYKQLSKYDLHGGVQLAPQFHGAWTVTLTTTNNHEYFKIRRRRVGVVLMEYIKGDSISDLCHMVGGTLLPKSLSRNELEDHIDPTSEANRCLVLELLLDGYVRQLFSGVEQGLLHPDNILIQQQKGVVYRVVLLNYRHSVVDPLCQDPKEVYDDFTNPPHPAGVIYMLHLEHLIGWVPREWAQNEKLLTGWLLRVFGKELNSDEYSSRPELRLKKRQGSPITGESGQAEPGQEEAGPAESGISQNLPIRQRGQAGEPTLLQKLQKKTSNLKLFG